MQKSFRVGTRWSGVILSCILISTTEYGCFLGMNVPPMPGNPITCTNGAGYDVVVEWGAATDNRTAGNRLEYRLVSSPDIAWIDTIEEVTALSPQDLGGAYVEMDWTPGALTATLNVILEGAPIYFSVLVRDEDGNLSLYSPVEYFG
jgi:hypothetical protein